MSTLHKGSVLIIQQTSLAHEYQPGKPENYPHLQ
jgi:hypothetical protein